MIRSVAVLVAMLALVSACTASPDEYTTVSYADGAVEIGSVCRGGFDGVDKPWLVLINQDGDRGYAVETVTDGGEASGSATYLGRGESMSFQLPPRGTWTVAAYDFETESSTEDLLQGDSLDCE